MDAERLLVSGACLAQKRSMMRAAPILFSMLVAGCGGGNEAASEATEQAVPVALAQGAERIECAVAGADTFAPDCSVERRMTGDGLALTVRAPHGGFRRLLVTKDGRGVIAADGAVPAQVTPVAANRIEVAIAGDRFRLPATVKQ